ncbi:MAG: cytochrome c [Verrucomicrobia bacterium]|nr:cytochrome c [Verrucomicrobiota bacterium]
MNAPLNSDPRLDQAAVTDESLLAAHAKLLGKQPDEKARYKLLPLNLLFIFSGLIFFAGTYLNRYSGRFDPRIFDENAKPGLAGGTADAAQADPVAVGKKLFNNATCNTCHQATGLGMPGAIPPLVGSDWVTGSEERVIRIVLHGLQGPIKVNGVDYNSAMPPFGRVAGSGFNWSDDKVAAVLTYIRQDWGNKGGPITTEKVAAIRAKEGDRKPWTVAELEKLP